MTIVYTKNETINLDWLESSLRKTIYNTTPEKYTSHTKKIVTVLRKSLILRFGTHINLRYLSLKRL